MIEAWKQWRFSLVTFDGKTLRDDLLDKDMIIRAAPEPKDDHTWFRYVKLQYERYLFANELVPMVKPFLLLTRMVPGREKSYLTRGPLPNRITIGPWSFLYAGGRHLSPAPTRNPVWADEAVRSTRRRGRAGSDTVSSWGGLHSWHMRQLVFQNLHAMARLPKNPEQMIDEPRLYKKARMPRNTCGIDATYYFRGISQFVAVNGDNQSKVWTSSGGLP